MTKEIPLTQGKVALVDDEDFEFLDQWKWEYTGGYAMRADRSGPKQKGILMHRVIMKANDNQEVDHIYHNKLDQRKDNLRLCNKHHQNSWNRNKNKNNTTGYKGVTYDVRYGLNREYRARIMVRNKMISLGLFPTAKKAALAYDEAARKYHGEFALTNFQKATIPGASRKFFTAFHAKM